MDLLTAVVIVAAAYVVVLSLVYVWRRLLIAGRVGAPHSVLVIVLTVVIGMYVVEGFYLGWSLAVAFYLPLLLLGVWIGWRLVRPFLDDMRAFWSIPAQVAQPVSPMPRWWPAVGVIAAVPGFSLLVLLLLIVTNRHP